MAEFLPRYEQHFKMAAMIEKENRKAVEASRRKYEQFVQQLDRDHQSMRRCLSVKPAEMQRRQEGKRQELLERCQGELRGEDPQKEAALEELKEELDRHMDEFLTAYGQPFKVKKAEWLGLAMGRGVVPGSGGCGYQSRHQGECSCSGAGGSSGRWGSGWGLWPDGGGGLGSWVGPSLDGRWTRARQAPTP
nr:uncharacterized protein LOC122172502 isoform X2 [Chrysemys picta bellii]